MKLSYEQKSSIEQELNVLLCKTCENYGKRCWAGFELYSGTCCTEIRDKVLDNIIYIVEKMD